LACSRSGSPRARQGVLKTHSIIHRRVP
jgi:hypothetical protein